VSLIGTLICASPSHAYRPFVPTDAAVADPGVLEVELGYFGVKRDRGLNSYVVPQVVLNYGLVGDLETVGEFSIETAPDHGPAVADPSLFLKAVLREGVLQEQRGASLAVEAGPLLPATVDGEKHFGFEGIGILSGELEPITCHLNLGGGVDRRGPNPFVIWGLIGELPVAGGLRLVGEVNGEETRRELPDNSFLIGSSIGHRPSMPPSISGSERGSEAPHSTGESRRA
jgi:hypothetical protein